MPDAEGLQFRDVAAFNERTAYLMSSGDGELSRIYRTDDSGRNWTLQYVADHPEAFLDCMDFWDVNRGLAYGDAVDGVPFLLMTSNGGASWERVPADALPPAQDGEGGFAASGTCVAALRDGRAWVAMGNAERARMLRTADYGQTWPVTDVPVVGGPASGLTTVHVGWNGVGIALGGRIGQDSLRAPNVAITSDGGLTWTAGGPLALDGPAYGSAPTPRWGGGGRRPSRARLVRGRGAHVAGERDAHLLGCGVLLARGGVGGGAGGANHQAGFSGAVVATNGRRAPFGTTRTDTRALFQRM